MSKKYVSEEQLETFLNVTIASGAADDAIVEATQLVDNITGRNFLADTSDVARLFDGNAKVSLPIDDCQSVSKVEIGSDYYGGTFTELDTDYYKLLPNNYDKIGIPIKKIHYVNGLWIAGMQNIRITGKWGYSTKVPGPVTLAATIIAAGVYMFNSGGGVSGEIESERIGNYNVSYKTEDGWKAYKRALQILQGYKKWVI